MRRARPTHYDDIYKGRIRDAVLSAVMTTSLTKGADGKDAAVIRSGEVFDALLEVSAFFIAGAVSLNSPAKIRVFVATEGKMLHRLIVAAQARKGEPDDIFVDLPDSYDD